MEVSMRLSGGRSGRLRWSDLLRVLVAGDFDLVEAL